MRAAARILVACSLCAAPAAAQPPILEQVKSGSVDLAVPESPAFTILDLTPQSVVRPDSPRMLAAGLLNGVNRQGHLQNGVAVDAAPYLLWMGDQVTLAAYRENVVVRLLSRAQVSAASTKGTSTGDPSARVGLGVHLTLFDRGDPRTDPAFAKQLADVGTQVLLDNQPPAPMPVETLEARADAWAARVEQQATALAEPYREAQRRRAWNATRWAVGAAAALRSNSGSIGDLEGDGGAVWTSLAYGFEDVPGLDDAAQLIVHARKRTGEEIDTEGSVGRQDHWLAGIRLRAGGPNGTGSFELTHVRASGDGGDGSYQRLAAGLERRLLRNVWLQVGIGGERGRQLAPAGTFLLTEFKWAAGER